MGLERVEGVPWPLCPACRGQAWDARPGDLGVVPLGVCAWAVIFCSWAPVEGAELEAMGTQRFSPMGPVWVPTWAWLVYLLLLPGGL